MFSCYFLVTEFGLLKNETHVVNYFTFKVKEINNQFNSWIVLSRNPDTIKKYSKTIHWIKSRNCDVI